MGKLRATVRPTHGEIEILKSDALSAARAREFMDYAASEEAGALASPPCKPYSSLLRGTASRGSRRS